jgi:invasion protein IalB
MKVFVGSTTVVTTGDKTLTLPDGTFQVKSVQFQVGSNNSAAAEHSTGFSDGENHRAETTIKDGSIEASKRSTNYAVTHYKVINGDLTLTLAGKVSTNGFSTAGQLGLTFDTCELTQSVDFIIYGE